MNQTPNERACGTCKVVYTPRNMGQLECPQCEKACVPVLTTSEIVAILQDIRERMVSVVEQVEAIGASIVLIIDKSPEGRKTLQKHLPELNSVMVRKFEAVGRGTMHPLLGPGSPFNYSMKVGSMPMDAQKNLVEGGKILLLTDTGNLRVGLAEMQPLQVKQLFAADHIRTLPEQRAYIEADRYKANKKKRPSPLVENYRIKNHKLEILAAPCEISYLELLKILESMKQ